MILCFLRFSLFVVFGIFAKSYALVQLQNWSIAPVVSHYHYGETTPEASNFMSLDGFMPGLELAFDFINEKECKVLCRRKPIPKWHYTLTGMVSVGQLAYDSSNSGSAIMPSNSSTNISFLINRSLRSKNLQLYFGALYREFVNDGNKVITTTSHGGYARTTNQIYAPFGIRFKNIASGLFDVGLEYDYLLSSTQTTDFTWMGGTSTKNNQPTGYGLRAYCDINLTDTRTGSYKLVLSPFWQLWNIGRSDDRLMSTGSSVFMGYEPQNRTTDVGLKLKVIF